MTGLVMRQAVLFVVVLIVPVLLIRAQPYDDRPLRALLTPASGCAPPCFMGLQPGRTTIWEALEVLRWEWSGAQPALIDPANQGKAWVLDDTVVSIDVDIRPRSAGDWPAGR